jgi:hypothetical protein
VNTLPGARGARSAFLLQELAAPPHALSPPPAEPPADALADEDLQLALYLCYELHYRGLPCVADEWEWEPSLLALRRELEGRFLAAIDDALAGWEPPPATPETMDLALRAIGDADDAPSLSRHLETRGTNEQLLEFLVQRSAYQLKEADPHTFAMPRLHGPPKSAFVEIQADEYGGGRPGRLHAELFAKTMAAVGLDDTYGAYLDVLPGDILATVNLISLFGLHRSRRGAAVGHLAMVEMTSSVPSRRYATALRRLGHEREEATDFFDEHVEADAVHEAVAAVDMAGGLARLEPELTADILFGARALVELEGRWATRVMSAWAHGRSSLLTPLPQPAAA